MSKITTYWIIQLSLFWYVAFSYCRVMIYLLDIIWFIRWTVLAIFALPSWSGWPAENNSAVILKIPSFICFVFCFVLFSFVVLILFRKFTLISLVSPLFCWENSVMHGGPHLPRQNLLFHAKTYFFHGKTYFSMAKLTFPRQNLLSHGKTYLSTANLTFSRQNFTFHERVSEWQACTDS